MAAEPESHQFPTPFVVSPTAQHTHTLILLHGRGDNGPSFGSGVYIATPSSGFRLFSLYPGLKFIFPTTAARFSTTFREVLNEWFDIVSLSFPEEHSNLQREGLKEAVAHINGIIDAEIAAGIPAENIILGGISQGCATALHVLLARGQGLGGFMGMSGWMPFASNIRGICGLTTGAGLRSTADHSESESEEEAVIQGERPPMHIDAVLKMQVSPPRRTRYPPPSKEKQSEALAFVRKNLEIETDGDGLEVLKTPVFLGHGDDDQTVDYKLGRNMYTTLKHGLGMDTTWKRYREFGHWYKVCSWWGVSLYTICIRVCLVDRRLTWDRQEPDEIDDLIEFWGEKCGLLPS
jgi:predicted esterase